MKLILNQAEIEAALTKHIFENLSIGNDQTAKIEFNATRGEDGITATIDIPYMGVTSLNLNVEPKAEEPVKTGPLKRGPKPKAQVQPQAVPATQANIFGSVQTGDADVGDMGSDLGTVETSGEEIPAQDNNEIVTAAPEIASPEKATKPSIFSN